MGPRFLPSLAPIYNSGVPILALAWVRDCSRSSRICTSIERVTVFSRRGPIGRTGQRLLPSALFLQVHLLPRAHGAGVVLTTRLTIGNSFLYDFQSKGQAGTFWYHSHLSAQYCDGLRGPMVVYDPLDPHRLLYDIDNGKSHICHWRTVDVICCSSCSEHRDYTRRLVPPVCH